jgi:digeranylgeranylglycerophospholipid reductase
MECPEGRCPHLPDRFVRSIHGFRQLLPGVAVQSSPDVIVVGAGPTGSYAAWGLARLGYGVLMLEEHQRVGTPAHCTGVISADAYRELGPDPSLVEAHLSGARLCSPRGQSFLISAPEARAVVVDRSRLDQWVCAQAMASGARLLLNARAHDVFVGDEKAVVVAEIEGEPASLQCSLAIVATGAKASPVRGNAARPRDTFLYGAQAETTRTGLAEVELYVGNEIAPGGYAWAVPLNGKCRVGLISRRPPGTYLSSLARSLEQREAITWDCPHVTYHQLPTGPVTPSFSERMLMVGDAAGQVKTTTGGGLYFGLIGAQAAVDVADRALRSGDVSAASLSRYEAVWGSRLGAEQRLGQLLRRLHAALTDEDLELLFLLARRTRMRNILSQLRFDWHSSGLVGLLCSMIPGL